MPSKNRYSSNLINAEQTAYLLDPILFKDINRRSEITPATEEELQHIIRYCINKKGLFFPRLVHLADAFSKTQGVQKVLSVGCGEAYQEAFLAGRLPEIRVDATDICLRNHSFSFPNLNFSEADILKSPDELDYDLVFSIECLEHIANYELAFKNIAAKVKPGKYLYISVPFANAKEQQDKTLRKQEWEAYQHHLPGFTFDNLELLFEENRFKVIYEGTMFNCSLINNINALLSKLDPEIVELGIVEIARLFFLDITFERAINRRQAVGVRFLGEKVG